MDTVGVPGVRAALDFTSALIGIGTWMLDFVSGFPLDPEEVPGTGDVEFVLSVDWFGTTLQTTDVRCRITRSLSDVFPVVVMN